MDRWIVAYSYNGILQGNEWINDSYTQCLDKSHKDVEKINQTHTKIQYGSIYIKFNSTLYINKQYLQTNKHKQYAQVCYRLGLNTNHLKSMTHINTEQMYYLDL